MALQTLTGGGVFTAGNIAALNNNFSALSGVDYWIRPQASVGDADGTYAKAFPSFAALGSRVVAGVTIGLEGVLKEEYTGPIVNDVTIIGKGNEPRQATSGGVPNGGGATWLSPTSGTGALLTVSGQSWKLQNVYLNNSSTTNPVIRLLNAGDPPALADAAGFTLRGCTLTGGQHGLLTRGGGYIVIDGNTFVGFSTASCMALGTEGGGVGTGSWARVVNNQFLANTRHIDAEANNWEVANNHFSYVNNGVTTTIFIDFTGGANNSVHHNHFDVNSGNGGISTMFVLGTNDRWGPNSLSSAVTTTLFSWGDPA